MATLVEICAFYIRDLTPLHKLPVLSRDIVKSICYPSTMELQKRVHGRPYGTLLYLLRKYHTMGIIRKRIAETYHYTMFGTYLLEDTQADKQLAEELERLGREASPDTPLNTYKSCISFLPECIHVASSLRSWSVTLWDTSSILKLVTISGLDWYKVNIANILLCIYLPSLISVNVTLIKLLQDGEIDPLYSYKHENNNDDMLDGYISLLWDSGIRVLQPIKYSYFLYKSPILERYITKGGQVDISYAIADCVITMRDPTEHKYMLACTKYPYNMEIVTIVVCNYLTVKTTNIGDSKTILKTVVEAITRNATLLKNSTTLVAAINKFIP